MSKLLQIAFVTIVTIFVFSGCASKVPPKNFALHKDTVQDIKQKDINFEVSNVKLTGDALNNKYLYSVIIDDEEIKTNLLANINKFYNNNPINPKIYKVDIDMNFENKKAWGDSEVGVNGIYKIYRENQPIETINISSNYVAEIDFGFKDAMFVTLFGVTGLSRNQTNQDFNYDTLEKVAYAEDNTVSLSSKIGMARVICAYTGAVRLNFAKFLQKFNELLNSENQTLAINK